LRRPLPETVNVESRKQKGVSDVRVTAPGTFVHPQSKRGVHAEG
jgi:hypothetical protein